MNKLIFAAIAVAFLGACSTAPEVNAPVDDKSVGATTGDRLDRAAAPAGRGPSLRVGLVDQAAAAAHAGLGQDQLDALGRVAVTGDRRGHRTDLLVTGQGQ
jgi:hypothetical protein